MTLHVCIKPTSMAAFIFWRTCTHLLRPQKEVQGNYITYEWMCMNMYKPYKPYNGMIGMVCMHIRHCAVQCCVYPCMHLYMHRCNCACYTSACTCSHEYMVYTFVCICSYFQKELWHMCTSLYIDYAICNSTCMQWYVYSWPYIIIYCFWTIIDRECKHESPHHNHCLTSLEADVFICRVS